MAGAPTDPMSLPAAGRVIASRQFAADLFADKIALTALVTIVGVVLMALLAPWIAPHSPSEPVLANRLLPPAWTEGGRSTYVLGTDALGRDLVSRMIFGARNDLLIGISVVLLAGAFGTLVGLVAGYWGGRWDTVIMRLVDAQLAFPGLLLVIVVLGTLGPTIPLIIAVLSIYGWMIFARIVRGNVLQLREELYVRAAQMAGCSSLRIMVKHLFPGLVPTLLTQSMLELARVMLSAAALAYLGLGIQPPNASWGLMVAENQVYLSSHWWTVFFPGMLLALTVLAINFLGSWWRVRSDPQLRHLQRTQRVTN